MLDDIEHPYFLNKIKNDALVIVLSYTNMCGTCDSAKRMLMIVNTILKDVPMFKINVNYYPQMALDYGLMSNPSFMVFKHGELIDVFYAFHSVPYLLEKITFYKEEK